MSTRTLNLHAKVCATRRMYYILATDAGEPIILGFRKKRMKEREELGE